MTKKYSIDFGANGNLIILGLNYISTATESQLFLPDESSVTAAGTGLFCDQVVIFLPSFDKSLLCSNCFSLARSVRRRDLLAQSVNKLIFHNGDLVLFRSVTQVDVPKMRLFVLPHR